MFLKKRMSALLRRAIKVIYPDLTLITTYKTWSYQRDYFLKVFAIDLAVDVGANVGQWASQFRIIRPNSKIISFEPDPRCRNILHDAAKNDPNWEIKYEALGSSDSLAVMNLWDMEGAQVP